MNVCVITWPLGDSLSAQYFLSDLLRILQHIFRNVYVLTEITTINANLNNNSYKIINLKVASQERTLYFKIFNYLIYQCKLCREVYKLKHKVDIVWVYGGASLLLPIIMCRLLNKKVYINVLGPESKRLRSMYPGIKGRFISALTYILEYISYKLAWRIVVESKSIIKFANLNKFNDKIITNGARFIDFERFKITKAYDDRPCLVGYIGRISPEKGIMSFIEAINLMQQFDCNRVNFIIGGDGPLLKSVKKYVSKQEKVKLMGWIPHGELPKILNNLKLLVLPSNTEGLPTIVLESLACGTPVLATNVGGIPDVIKDRKTGFLMSNNEPQTIANSIFNIINGDVDRIIINGRKLVQQEYGFYAVLNNYSNMFTQ